MPVADRAKGIAAADGDVTAPRRIVGVIQARTDSSRLPGKVMAMIGDRALVEWTVAAMSAVPSLEALVVATTNEPGDDALARALADSVAVHRGPTYDVLSRCWEAVAPFEPTIVVRQTADNPFVDPDVVQAQIDRLLDGGFDFVGNVGWPLGIAAEVALADALRQAYDEAVDAAEREHVMPFLYARPERFRIGSLAVPGEFAHDRYTVDTEADLALARALARHLGHGPPTRLPELEALVRADPGLALLNAGVHQKHWREVDQRASARGPG
jgi:spore coat polysaccharide biosynthesis protein SpsF